MICEACDAQQTARPSDACSCSSTTTASSRRTGSRGRVWRGAWRRVAAGGLGGRAQERSGCLAGLCVGSKDARHLPLKGRAPSARVPEKRVAPCPSPRARLARAGGSYRTARRQAGLAEPQLQMRRSPHGRAGLGGRAGPVAARPRALFIAPAKVLPGTRSLLPVPPATRAPCYSRQPERTKAPHKLPFEQSYRCILPEPRVCTAAVRSVDA